MKYLFIHHNFPAQFRHMAATLAARPGNEVVYLTEEQHSALRIPAVKIGIVPVSVPPRDQGQVRFDTEVILRRSEAFAKAMLELTRRGFTPDVVYDHCGWGCGLYIQDVFPRAFRATYCEWFFNHRFPYTLTEMPPEDRVRSFAPERSRMHCQLDAIANSNLAVTPTFWQQAQYPERLRKDILVVHDGIDTDFFSPAEQPQFYLQGSPPFSLPEGTEIVSYTCRAFEPCRGFPQVMRSLPHMLRLRPNCHVAIMGEDRVSYDPPPARTGVPGLT